MNIKKKPTFGICSPSSNLKIRRAGFDEGLKRLRSLGHEIIVHPQTYAELGNSQLAGTVDEKLTALYELSADPRVDMIMAARGGCGQAHLLGHIDFLKIRKPFIGYSDNTVLLNALFVQHQSPQFHGPDVRWFREEHFDAKLYEQFLSVIMGGFQKIPLSNAHIQNQGQTSGRLIGGNMKVFQYLLNTSYCPDLTGAILFFEDIGEEISSFDRLMNYLRLLGVFDRVGGMIFGQFSDMKDTGQPFGFSVEEIIAQYTSKLSIPIITNAPFGHTGLLTTFPVGAVVTLDARGGTPVLTLEK